MSNLARCRIVVALERGAAASLSSALKPLRAALRDAGVEARVTEGKARSVTVLALGAAPAEAFEAVDLAVERVAAGLEPFTLPFGAPEIEARGDGEHLLRATLVDAEGRWAALLDALRDAVGLYGFETVAPADGPELVFGRAATPDVEALRAAAAGLRLGALPVGRLDVQTASESPDGRRVFSTRRRIPLGAPAGPGAGRDAAGDRAAIAAELERRMQRRSAHITVSPSPAPPAPPKASKEPPGDEA
jgi:hypothetical protein